MNQTLQKDAYNRGFKSYNKQSSGLLGQDKFYHDRRVNAKKYIKAYRNARKAAHGNDQFFNPSTVFATQAQNCGELLEMAAMLLSDCGLNSRVANFIGSDNDHALLLIGDELPADLANVKWGQLPPDVVVCDPWMNITCVASAYPVAYAQKMQKWANKGKQLIEEYDQENGRIDEYLVEPNTTPFDPDTFELKIHDLGPKLLGERVAVLAQAPAPGP